MCILSFISFNNEAKNFYKDINITGILTHTLMIENSRIANKDGCGIYSPASGVWKSEKEPILVPDFGEHLKMLGGPTIAHVRFGTYFGTGKNISVNNSHPFIYPNLVLAHNGSLEPIEKDLDKKPEFKDKTDSDVFAYILNETLSTSTMTPLGEIKTTFLNGLVDTYSKFNGKFAFMAIDLRDGNFYIARGDTADLHYTFLTIEGCPIGVVVNTNQEFLAKSITNISSISSILIGKSIQSSKIEEIPKNTVLVYNYEKTEFDVIGKMVETKKPVTTYNYKREYDDHYYLNQREYIPPTPSVTTYTRPETKIELSNPNTPKEFVTILNFLRESGLSIFELDSIAKIIMNKSILQLNQLRIEELSRFLKDNLSFESSNKKDHKRLWNKIVAAQKYPDVMAPYYKFNITFPFSLLPQRTLKELAGEPDA